MLCDPVEFMCIRGAGHVVFRMHLEPGNVGLRVHQVFVMGKAQADPGAYGNRPADGLNSGELRGTRRHALQRSNLLAWRGAGADDFRAGSGR